MIVRIVKMSFKAENCEEFEQIFEQSKPRIKAMPGCRHVELLKEIHDGTVYFTRSIWDSENDLNQYRKSDLFKGVWKATKALFDQPAQAWSTELLAAEKEH